METLTGHLLSWVAVVFVVCSIASGKRTNYILPLYPAAAMLVGRYVASWLEQGANGGRALRITGIVSAGALSLLAVVLALWRAGQQPWTLVLPWLHPRDREVLPAVVSLLGPPPLAILLGVASLAGALLVAVFFRASRTVAALLGLVLLFATLAGTAVARPVEGRWKSFEPFAARVASRVSPGDPLYFFRKPQYALLFYLRRHVPVESRRFDAIPTSAWALVWEEDWNRLDGSKRRRGEIVEVSRPVAPHRPDSRLLLVRFLPEPAGG
jgi:hypothetical protein